MGLAILVLLATALSVALPPPDAAARFPAIRARMTIVGRTSGLHREATLVRPQAPGCPAQRIEVEERADVRWKATFAPVVVPLAVGPYTSYSPPHYHGGVVGGSYGFRDTYLREAPEPPEPSFAEVEAAEAAGTPLPEPTQPCPTMSSFSAAAKLSQRPRTYPFWDDRELAPAVVFGLGTLGGAGYGSIAATPARIDAPELEWDGVPSGLVPVDVANALPLYGMTRRPLAMQALPGAVVLNWKRLQSRLAPLRHGATVTLLISKRLGNARRPAPFEERCFHGGAHPSCTETMRLRYTITLRRISAARGCDLGTFETCLLWRGTEPRW